MTLKPIRTIIIDDDKDWHDILSVLIKSHPKLNFLGSFLSPMDAYTLITEGGVDLILLDIQMPDINGIDFIKHLHNPPLIIFVTSYAEFAVQSYEVNAVDYLLKPITTGRFLQAIEKAVVRLSSTESDVNTKDQFFFIRENNYFVKIDIDNVLFLKSMENYTQIVAADRTYTTLMTLSAIEEQLSPTIFRRVHRSYIVNISKITLVNKTELFINDYQIPLTRTFAESIMEVVVKSHLISKKTGL